MNSKVFVVLRILFVSGLLFFGAYVLYPLIEPTATPVQTEGIWAALNSLLYQHAAPIMIILMGVSLNILFYQIALAKQEWR